MNDSALRSLVKAISWRITGSVDTFLVSWVITGKLMLAGSIAATEVVTKIALYWVHERVWLRVPFGVHKDKHGV